MTTATLPEVPVSQSLFSDTEASGGDFPYRSLSRAAIASLVLFFLALPGLLPTFEPLLALAIFGIIAGVVAISTVRRYPHEYSGGLLGQVGLMLNAFLLVGGTSMHTYIYMTEVPDGYSRVAFYELQMPESMPDGPTSRAAELDGASIFLKGYIHPSSGSGLLNRFVLVPDLGTCCFGGEPRSSSMIEVILPRGQSVQAGLMRRKLAGKFELNRFNTSPDKFENPVFYRLKADLVN